MPDYPPLSLTRVETPANQDQLVALVQSAAASGTPLYPIGGSTSLLFGLPPKSPGVGVVLTGLNRVIDFPARDLTITVEAGITMQALAEVLAQEGLRLPIDVPQPNVATLGGVIATAWSGPRRYGHGAMRDFVIGIRAIDGHGEVFQGGGRVVKNVAGYDFCKLLTGSLGVLGIITQVTLKLRPLVQQTALLALRASDLSQAEAILTALAHCDTTPVAIELVDAPATAQHAALREYLEDSAPTIFIGQEGTAVEVQWMIAELQRALASFGPVVPLPSAAVPAAWQALTEISATAAPLVLRASVLPSRVTTFIAGVRQIDPQATMHAHAGNGVVDACLSQFPAAGLSRTVVATLQPLATTCGGHLVILANPSGQEATPQSTWGALGSQQALMVAVKQQFDPHNLLNPGRFVC